MDRARLNDLVPPTKMGMNALWQKNGTYFQYIFEPPSDADLIKFYVYERDVELTHKYDFPYKVNRNVALDKFFSGAETLPESEQNVLKFLVAKTPRAQLLVGDIGTGKTSLIRHMILNLLDEFCKPEIKPFYKEGCFIYIDLNIGTRRYKSDDQSVRTDVRKLINDSINHSAKHLMTREEERGGFWNWICEHFSPLSKYADLLRFVDSESDRQKKILDFRSEILKDESLRLDYLAAKIRFTIETKYRNDSTRILVVLDNIDHFPPKYQRNFAEQAVRFAEVANCKVIIPLRSPSYRSNREAYTKVVDFIRIHSPGIERVLDARLDFYVRNRTLPNFIKHVNETLSSRGDPLPQTIFPMNLDFRGRTLHLKFEDIKKFFTMIRTSYNQSKENLQHTETRIGEFSDKVLNGNVRHALLLALEFAQSHLLHIDRIIGEQPIHDSDWPPFDPKKGIPYHHFLKSVMLRDLSRYDSSSHPYIDNIFHVNCPEEDGNLLIQYRILKYVSKRAQKKASLHDIVHHLKIFKYSDELIQSAVLESTNPQKMLLVNERYRMLDVTNREHLYDLLHVTPCGAFYLNTLMNQWEYLVQVIPDSFVSKKWVEKYLEVQNDGSKRVLLERQSFNDRIRITLEFIEQLHIQDMIDRQNVAEKGAWNIFTPIYRKNSSFVVDMLENLIRQITKINPRRNIFRHYEPESHKRKAILDYDRVQTDLKQTLLRIKRELRSFSDGRHNNGSF